MAPATNHDPQIAVLDNRTRGLETAVNKLETEIVAIQTTVNAGFAALQDKIAQRDRTPWGTILTAVGVLITFMTVVGALAYAPIKGQTDSLQDSLTTLRRELRQDNRAEAAERVTRREHDAMEKRMDRIEAEIFWRRQRYMPERKE